MVRVIHDSGQVRWHTVDQLFVLDVHTEHCCYLHGCKYMGEDDCPVAAGEKPQSHACEACDFELYEAGGWELAHLINDMITKERNWAVETLCRIWTRIPAWHEGLYEVEQGLEGLLGKDWYQICRDRSHL